MPTDFSQFFTGKQQGAPTAPKPTGQGTDFSQFMKPLNPDQNHLGIKSKPVLGSQPKGRLASAKEAFTGSIKSGFGRLKESQESFKKGGNIFTQPKATLKALGGLGDIASSPFAGITGLAQPEIEKGVGFVAKKIPEPVKQQASKLIEAVPEEARGVLSDAFAATGLLALPSKAPLTSLSKQLQKKGFRGALRKGEKALEESAKKTVKARKGAFVEDLVKPSLTKKVAEEQVSRTLTKGPFAKKVIKLSPEEQLIKSEVLKIKGLKPGMTKQQSFNVISKENTNIARRLETQIKKNDFIFPKKELNSKLRDATRRLSENPTLTGNAERTAEKIMSKFQQLVDKSGAKGSGLLKARKDLDKWIRANKPKAFDAQTENAFDLALKEIRKTANNFLDEKAINVGVKQSLKKQSTLFRALENIAPKAAKEAPKAFGRVVQKAEGLLGSGNKVVKEIAALSLVGGGFAVAPGVVGTGVAASLGLKGFKAALTSPKTRKALGKLLKEISKRQVNAKGAAVAELKELKNSVEKALKEK